MTKHTRTKEHPPILSHRIEPRGIESGIHVCTPKSLVYHLGGLYGKVARQLVVDPSYVSRVARGECESKSVEDALRRELIKIRNRITKLNAVR
jgi:hypothetical protein